MNHAMKTCGRVEAFLTFALLQEDDWSILHHRCFTSEESATNTQWIGGWVVPRARLDTMEKRKIS
jgi:hypothetical protein